MSTTLPKPPSLLNRRTTRLLILKLCRDLGCVRKRLDKRTFDNMNRAVSAVLVDAVNAYTTTDRGTLVHLR